MQNLKKWEIERRKYWEINFDIQIGSKSSEWVPGTQMMGPKYQDPKSQVWNVRVPSAGSHSPGTQMKGPR